GRVRGRERALARAPAQPVAGRLLRSPRDGGRTDAGRDQSQGRGRRDRPRPLPHVVVDDLLPEAFFRELAETIPPIEYFKQARNGRKADLPMIPTNKAFL